MVFGVDNSSASGVMYQAQLLVGMRQKYDTR